jgi:hypothetical protein
MFDAKDDIPRAQALAEILCGAAQVDDELDPDEALAVGDALRSLLGLTTLPPEVERHVRSFKPQGFDVAGALGRLRLSELAHKKALLRSVRSILKADGIMRDTERDYMSRLASILRLNASDID